MPFGWSGLIVLIEFVVMIAVALMIARFLLIQTVRIIRREWTRQDPPRN
jgi:hypothetical protein